MNIYSYFAKKTQIESIKVELNVKIHHRLLIFLYSVLILKATRMIWVQMKIRIAMYWKRTGV